MEAAVISAFVAAFVTLAIEFAAKPRLEARKDRILQRDRQAREARALLQGFSFEVGRYQAWQHLIDDMAPHWRLDEITARAGQRLDRLSELVVAEDLPLTALQLDALEVTCKLGDLWLVANRSEDIRAAVQLAVGDLDAAIEVAAEAMTVRWWQRKSRQTLTDKIRRLQQGPHRRERSG